MPATSRWLLGFGVPVGVAAATLLWLRTPPVRPNFVLVTVDTLRADHVGAYGYGRATSSNIDRLAKQGVVFERAFAQATLSGPSHATIMTSREVPAHGVINNAVDLREDQLTLAEVLRMSGYDTAMFVSEVYVSEEFGFAQGFDRAEIHRVHSHDHDHHRPGEEEEEEEPEERLPRGAVFERALDWLGQPREKPFFLWVHAQHLHQSYEPPAPFDRMFGEPPRSTHDLRCRRTLDKHEKGEITLEPAERDYIVSLYDGEIAYVDDQIGRMLARLDSLGLREKTVMVITADHGEMLFDDPAQRETGHGRDRFDAVLRVPLILAGPVGASGRRVPAMVGLIDVAPTVLELAGVKRPRAFQGVSLVPSIKGRRRAVRDTNHSCTFHRDGTIRLSERTDRLKMTCNRRQSVMKCELYDLERDPREQRDVSADPAYAKRAGALRASLGSWFENALEKGRLLQLGLPDEQALKLLREAGYLEDEGLGP